MRRSRKPTQTPEQKAGFTYHGITNKSATTMMIDESGCILYKPIFGLKDSQQLPEGHLADVIDIRTRRKAA